MENKSEWDKCSKCGKEITDNNFGDIIEVEKVLVCDSCSRKHRLYIITELNKFRQSKEFNDKLALRKKILWTSEQLGNWFDNATGTEQESVSDYNNFNLFELQVFLLDIFQTLLEKYIFPDLEIDYSKKYPELEKLRLEVREQQGRIASYINIKEFMDK